MKVYDTVLEEETDLTYNNNIQLYSFSFVLACHPVWEEILLSGSEGGKVLLWNLRLKTLLKSFKEYGGYAPDGCYTFNDPFDGKFTPDG